MRCGVDCSLAFPFRSDCLLVWKGFSVSCRSNFSGRVLCPRNSSDWKSGVGRGVIFRVLKVVVDVMEFGVFDFLLLLVAFGVRSCSLELGGGVLVLEGLGVE